VHLSPSHLNDFLECEHLTALELAVARGELARPQRDDGQAELIRRKGGEHERAYLADLLAQGNRVVEIELSDDWHAAASCTEEAMRSLADVVYQAVFVHNGWRGIADFLELQPDGVYQVADTKLARHARPYHLLQLCSKSRVSGLAVIARLQDLTPGLRT
jgi:predicted RecB family nuclease